MFKLLQHFLTHPRSYQHQGGAPTQPQQPGVDDALSAESSGGWNSESSPGEFVNDHTVQEWTPAKNRVDAYVASKHQNSMIEEVI